MELVKMETLNGKHVLQLLLLILLRSGRHTMLSQLSSLPLSSIKDIDDQADVIIIRTDPLYKTVALVQSTTCSQTSH